MREGAAPVRRARPAAGLLALAAVALAPCPAPGAPPTPDALDAQILEIRSLLRDRRYPIALESLHLLARSIQELRLEEVRPAFPPPPRGWTADEPLSLSADPEPWSLRIEARREYRREDGGARVSLTLDLHSPWIPAVSLQLNPLFVAGDPLARLVEVGGAPGRLRFAPDAGDGDLRVLVGGDVLVTAAGHGLESGDLLLELVRGVDLDLLRTRAGR